MQETEQKSTAATINHTTLKALETIEIKELRFLRRIMRSLKQQAITGQKLNTQERCNCSENFKDMNLLRTQLNIYKQKLQLNEQAKKFTELKE